MPAPLIIAAGIAAAGAAASALTGWLTGKKAREQTQRAGASESSTASPFGS